MMVKSGVLDALLDHVTSQQLDVHRCAITGVANLAKDD